MKFSVAQKDLQSALKRVTKLVPSNSTIPILSHVLLKAAKDHLVITATDLDIEASTTIPAEVESQGAITVSGKMLNDIVKKLKADVTFWLDDKASTMQVKSGRSRFTLQTLPKDDFPAIEAGESNHKIMLSAADLQVLFGRTQFAISTEATRYYLNGVYLHQAGTEAAPLLRGTATDGHRLASADIALPVGAAGITDANNATGILVPRNTVAEALRLIDDVDEVQVQVAPNRIAFAFGETRLVSKLIDGTFPDYARVIPVGNDKTLSVGREVLAEALERVASVLGKDSRAVKLSIGDSLLGISVTNPDAGSAQEDVEVTWTNDPLDIGFNVRYMGDILGNIGSASVDIRLSDAGSPALISGQDEQGTLYVLMPMRV